MYLIDISKNFNQVLRCQFVVDLVHQYQKLENSDVNSEIRMILIFHLTEHYSLFFFAIVEAFLIMFYPDFPKLEHNNQNMVGL